MSFEQVTNPNPIVVPAVAEKNFNKLWITKINISSPRPDDKSQATIEGIPWDGAREVLYSSPVVTKTIRDIFKIAQTDPEMASAINSILKMVNKYGV
jgi:hypothetical protein